MTTNKFSRSDSTPTPGDDTMPANDTRNDSPRYRNGANMRDTNNVQLPPPPPVPNTPAGRDNNYSRDSSNSYNNDDSDKGSYFSSFRGSKRNSKSSGSLDKDSQIRDMQANMDRLYREVYKMDQKVHELESNLNATGYWYSLRGSVRWLIRQLVLMALPMICLGAYLLYMNGGPGGQTFIDRSTPPLVSENALQVIASLHTPPGNLAISHSQPNRLFFTHHPEYDPETKLAEFDLTTGTWKAWPNLSWQKTFYSPLSVRIDHKHDVLWVLDFAHYGLGTVEDPLIGIPLSKRFYGVPALYAFSLHNDSLVHSIELGDVAGVGSMLNDFVISPNGEYLYIADTSLFRANPGLIVYSVEERSARRVLSGHTTMYAENYTPQVEGSGPIVVFKMFVVRPHVDSIALSADGQWLYYGPFSHEYLFRIPAELLHNSSTTDKELEKHIEVYSKKSMSEGIIMDSKNNIYVTDVEHSAIHRIDPQGRLQTLVKSRTLLRWCDGLSLSADESELYIASSALHLKFGGQSTARHSPYHITKLSLKDIDSRIDRDDGTYRGDLASQHFQYQSKTPDAQRNDDDESQYSQQSDFRRQTSQPLRQQPQQPGQPQSQEQPSSRADSNSYNKPQSTSAGYDPYGEEL